MVLTVAGLSYLFWGTEYLPLHWVMGLILDSREPVISLKMVVQRVTGVQRAIQDASVTSKSSLLASNF